MCIAFGGGKRVKMLILVFITVKGTTLGDDASFEPSYVKIGRGSDIERCFRKINNFRFISPICQRVPRGRIYTKFGTGIGVVDVIT